MRTTIARKLLFTVAAFGLVTAAHANNIAIFNTGVDSSGTPLPDGSLGESHYTLVSVPSGTTTLAVRTSVGGFPIPPWIGDDSLSAWIGPNGDQTLTGPAGNYDYQTTFDLTGLDPTTAVLSGLWASDDQGTDILINGVSTGFVNGDGFGSFDPFTISGGFVAGINTLDFLTNNITGPTSLRTEITGSASPSPEPSSLWLLGAGLTGLGVIRRRHFKSLLGLQ